MKRTIGIILVTVICFALGACTSAVSNESAGKISPSISPTTNPSNSPTVIPTPVPTKTLTGNLLMDAELKILPVWNGSKTEVIGTSVRKKISKSDISKITAKDYVEFVNKFVADADMNWVTIDFGDGTGIVFPGCNTEYGTYGKIDKENGKLLEETKDIFTKDNPVLSQIIK